MSTVIDVLDPKSRRRLQLCFLVPAAVNLALKPEAAILGLVVALNLQLTAGVRINGLSIAGYKWLLRIAAICYWLGALLNVPVVGRWIDSSL